MFKKIDMSVPQSLNTLKAEYEIQAGSYTVRVKQETDNNYRQEKRPRNYDSKKRTHHRQLHAKQMVDGAEKYYIRNTSTGEISGTVCHLYQRNVNDT